jgi:hypothetical protein
VFDEISIRRIDLGAYSPDLTPSDFDLFGRLKGGLDGHEFISTEQFLVVIRVLIDTVDRSFVGSV